MIRILIYTDTPCIYSGLARCGRELSKKFLEATEIIATKPTKKFELAYAGWHHKPKRHEYPYFIYPVGKGSTHEDKEIKDILDDFKPEVLLSVGDIWNFVKVADTICNYKEISKLRWISWLTVDGGNWHPTWKRILNLIDEICVFSEFGKDEVQRLVGFAPGVIYPGVDKAIFRKINIELKTKNTELPFDAKNTFIVLNINQNTDRKNIPLTLESFAEFSKDKEDVFLLLVTNPDDPCGFDLWDLINKLDLKKKVAITKESGPSRGMTDEKLNLLYNISSVSVNTSIGEGLSLPTLEAMAAGLPVITTDYAATSELIDKGGGFKIDIAAYLYGYSGIRRAIASKDDLVKKLNILYNDYKTSKSLKSTIATKSANFTDLLSWENTAKKFIDKIEQSIQKKEENLSFVKTKVKIKEINPLVIIPSWGKNCGIAEYTRTLLKAMCDLRLSIDIFQSYSYKEVPNLIKTQNYNLVHIQHEFSFFKSKQEFEQLLNSLNELKVKIIVTLHSLVPAMNSINEFLLTRADDVIVHCDGFKNILMESIVNKKQILSNMSNIEIIEMGCGDIFFIDENRIIETKKNLDLLNRYPIIGSFGFLREQKGYHDLLLAIKELRSKYENILLLIVAPKHEFGSKMYDDTFYNFIEKHNLENNVLVIREYLEETKLLSVLQIADAFVLNHIDSPYGGGISAAVKTLFRVQRPILVREGISFTDLVKGEVIKVRDVGLSQLVEAIKTLLEDKILATSLVNNANDFLIKNNWKNVAQKHLDLYNK